jgi:DNA-binding NarL/FixJ family response regulator
LLHRRENEEQAVAVLSNVGLQATAFGATTLSLLARRDLRSIGLRPTGAKQAPMSRRERQVADLLVAGRSNTEIARTLGISDRTVQCHVRRVLEALELPSRASIPHALGRRATVPPTADLTTRQREVADLVVRGYTNTGIARALGVSVKTVEKHLGDIYRRLDVSSRAALAARWPSDQPALA